MNRTMAAQPFSLLANTFYIGPSATCVLGLGLDGKRVLVADSNASA